MGNGQISQRPSGHHSLMKSANISKKSNAEFEVEKSAKKFTQKSQAKNLSRQ
jgi:hypothetical protein